jgi:formyl-CoA transferase
MSTALDGVKILDFTHVQSGSNCTQLLAWNGADVIKIERAGEGVSMRGQLLDIAYVDSLYFILFSLNKRSITLDVKKLKARMVLGALIKQCHVLVENFILGAVLGWRRSFIFLIGLGT